MPALPEDAVVIASRTQAGEVLCSPRRRAGIAYLVSIGGPTERAPAGMRNVRERVRLVFEDELTQAEGGPSEGDIKRLVAFARRIDPRNGRVLVQCQAGISRSAAAAMVILSVLLGPGEETEAARRVLHANPEARPNWRMLELAEAELERSGALTAAWVRLSSEAAGRPTRG